MADQQGNQGQWFARFSQMGLWRNQSFCEATSAALAEHHAPTPIQSITKPGFGRGGARLLQETQQRPGIQEDHFCPIRSSLTLRANLRSAVPEQPKREVRRAQGFRCCRVWIEWVLFFFPPQNCVFFKKKKIPLGRFFLRVSLGFPLSNPQTGGTKSEKEAMSRSQGRRTVEAGTVASCGLRFEGLRLRSLNGCG